MRIIYIAGVRIPTERAHGIHIMKMCEAFALLGHEVELAVPKRFNKIKKDPFDYYCVKRNFKLIKLPCLDLIPLDKYIGVMGLHIMEASFLFSLFFYLLDKKIDLLYIRDKLLLPLVFFKKNSIFEAHTFPKNPLFYAPFIKRVKRVVVITKKLKEQFGAKALVAPDGVDINKFKIQSPKSKIREKLGLPQDKKIVLYAGHLYVWKGVDTLLEAARNSQFTIPNLQFVFIGGTKEDIESFKVKAEGLKNVLIVGYKPHSEIPFWLRAADVLVLPNSGKEEISRHWTSPLKMFEYMASGAPIVASDLPSIREVLNSENAILVESDNPEALARGIVKALEDKSLSDRISERALSDVRQYTWLKRAEKILFQINHAKV